MKSTTTARDMIAKAMPASPDRANVGRRQGKSRNARKRWRLKQARANAFSPKTAGGWGKGLPLTPRDLLMVRQAIRENWDVPDVVRTAVIENVYHEALKPGAAPRLQVAAIRCILAMTAANQQERFAAIDAARASAQAAVPHTSGIIIYPPGPNATEALCHSTAR